MTECSECGPVCECPTGMQYGGAWSGRARIAAIAETLGDMTAAGMIRATTQDQRDLLKKLERLLK